jgi:transcriptional regulator with XRE-family HTH domain
MSDETARRLGEVISERVRHYRERQGLRQEDVAQRTAELGHPINRVSIAKIEKGGTRADNLPLVDLLTLAAALNVPPTLLFVPLGQAAEVAVTPELRLESWLLVDWLEGRVNLPELLEWSWATPDEQGAWRGRVQALALYRRLRELIDAVSGARGWTQAELDRLVGRGDAESVTAAKEEQQAAEDEALRQLGVHLEYMEAAGLLVPDLSDRLRKRMVELGVRRET